MFDGNDAEAVTSACQRWKDCVTAGFAVTYWQQNERGGWEKRRRRAGRPEPGPPRINQIRLKSEPRLDRRPVKPKYSQAAFCLCRASAGEHRWRAKDEVIQLTSRSGIQD